MQKKISHLNLSFYSQVYVIYIVDDTPLSKSSTQDYLCKEHIEVPLLIALALFGMHIIGYGAYHGGGYFLHGMVI